MKLLPLLLLFLFGCQKSDNVTVLDEPKMPELKKPNPEYLIDSLAIAGKMYTVVQGYPTGKNELPLSILYKGDTIYKHPQKAGNGFDFEDVDGNGIPEVMMNQLSNVGGVYECIMFDPKSQGFKEVKKFDEFPDSKKLPGTQYFYSDHHMGCAGGMWGSELFYIDNFEAKAIAGIFIVTCETADYVKGVTISKLSGNNETVIEQMDKVPEKYTQDYTGFFKEYWSGNYKKFE
ncbi:hypothetical protein AM493_09710 [Flavobacterium akiainvivens]|uniref:Uncharacterized protein n=1 Tax=Flavobacterium akiainvivens TaxID=1202724 RepID=A0A0M8MI54_9FLAO|nr:hypothetical protein [Flavobacterium akiainvivens]KOS06277.1 hypothetical protein AM493_09710 [Flavobacterium akiainvivens]SFQ17345.1 hypothetical protein SAMN05444144_101422 [Flavobacterium akiainvivens]